MMNFEGLNGEFYLHEDPEADAILRDFFVNYSQLNVSAVINAENSERYRRACSAATYYVKSLVPDAEIKVYLGGIFNLNGIWECIIPEFGFDDNNKDNFLKIFANVDNLSIGASNDGFVQVIFEVRNILDPVRK